MTGADHRAFDLTRHIGRALPPNSSVNTGLSLSTIRAPSEHDPRCRLVDAAGTSNSTNVRLTRQKP